MSNTTAGDKTYMLIGDKYGEVRGCDTCGTWIFKDGEHVCYKLEEKPKD